MLRALVKMAAHTHSLGAYVARPASGKRPNALHPISPAMEVAP